MSGHASWYDAAVARIVETLAALPPNATLADAEKAIREAYPWGERAHWPYKMWLKAKKHVLAERAKFAAFEGQPRHSWQGTPLEQAGEP